MRITKSSKVSAKGFTLVELSIVIIIISFIIAGIAAGTSLINQASINSIVTDMQAYQTSYNNFILRYNAIPGDFAGASNYWNNCADTNASCDGNGNRIIEYSVAPIGAGGTGDEVVRAFRHLALANMVGGAGGNQLVDGVSGGNLVIGTDIPASKISGAGYWYAGPIADIGHGAAFPSPWNNGKTNAIFIGVKEDLHGLVLSALTPDDAFSVDKKMDDGVVDAAFQSIGATTGRFRVTEGTDSVALGCHNLEVYTTGADIITCVGGFAVN